MDGRKALRLYLLIILSFILFALFGCAARQPSSTDPKPHTLDCAPQIIEINGRMQEVCCWADYLGVTHCRFTD